MAAREKYRGSQSGPRVNKPKVAWCRSVLDGLRQIDDVAPTANPIRADGARELADSHSGERSRSSGWRGAGPGGPGMGGTPLALSSKDSTTTAFVARAVERSAVEGDPNARVATRASDVVDRNGPASLSSLAWADPAGLAPATSSPARCRYRPTLGRTAARIPKF